ncbi:MAG: hypothetical protein QGG40_08530 [Myxococcota bacterium]|jgi:hypothetical protein|nr:hypothetical protein [Myxococcota bacterium]
MSSRSRKPDPDPRAENLVGEERDTPEVGGCRTRPNDLTLEDIFAYHGPRMRMPKRVVREETESAPLQLAEIPRRIRFIPEIPSDEESDAA